MVFARPPLKKSELAREYEDAIVDGGEWNAPIEFAMLAIMEAFHWSQADYEDADAWLIDMAEIRMAGGAEGHARKRDKKWAQSQVGGNPAQQLMAANRRRGGR